jgi:hypothetical protein
MSEEQLSTSAGKRTSTNPNLKCIQCNKYSDSSKSVEEFSIITNRDLVLLFFLVVNA